MRQFRSIGIGMLFLVVVVGCKQSSGSSKSDLQRPAEKTTEEAASSASRAIAAKASAITLVNEPSKVCMVNNQYMGRDQIPVVVDGKTYFGCCPMCKGRLERDPSTRSAIDPVSNRSVDKALAVIGRTESGDVFYFENRENLQRYASR